MISGPTHTRRAIPAIGLAARPRRTTCGVHLAGDTTLLGVRGTAQRDDVRRVHERSYPVGR
ncbi:hypothetical protein ACFY0P_09005 [Streptomyces sp. NPDC001714]|uniref:hypothetical protein n=1 Tax=Streptomyces sp. NPDC001714 TaxID=3364603 RepID=UPI0036C834AD